MKKFIIILKNPEQWKWKINKYGKAKMKIRGKLKKWLKRNCSEHYIIVNGEVPPFIWITNETDALLFHLTWD